MRKVVKCWRKKIQWYRNDITSTLTLCSCLKFVMHSAMNFVKSVFPKQQTHKAYGLNYPLLQTEGEVLVCASRHQKVARHCQLVQGRAAGHRLTHLLLCLLPMCWTCQAVAGQNLCTLIFLQLSSLLTLAAYLC